MGKFRVHECRAIAERALRLAAEAHNPEAKHTYVRLAALWHGLADHLSERENRDSILAELTGDPGETGGPLHHIPGRSRTNGGE